MHPVLYTKSMLGVGRGTERNMPATRRDVSDQHSRHVVTPAHPVDRESDPPSLAPITVPPSAPTPVLYYLLPTWHVPLVSFILLAHLHEPTTARAGVPLTLRVPVYGDDTLTTTCARARAGLTTASIASAIAHLCSIPRSLQRRVCRMALTAEDLTLPARDRHATF